MKCNQRGFTLIEMVITMALFVIIIMIISTAFDMILAQTKKLMRSEESNIEGVIGLETLRHDLQQGGFGLPDLFPAAPPQYLEAAYAPSDSYNDAPSGVPRPFVSGNNLAGVSETSSGLTYNILDGSDYLAIKGTSVSRQSTSQRWTYLRYSSASPRPNTWPSAAENITNNAYVVVLRRTFNAGQTRNLLVVDSSVAADQIEYFSPTYQAAGLSAANFNPPTANDIHFIYGIDTSNIRMPFNRTDYFVSRPDAVGSMSSVCAPNTGNLYKTSLSHANGKLVYIPLVDCIADMQVVYGWDMRNGGASGTDGLIDTYSNADGTTAVGAGAADIPAAVGDAAVIQNNLKLIKIYFLAQTGRKDPAYSSPASFDLFDTGESSLGRTYTLTSAMRNYRWKVYRLVVTPKNLLSNQ